MADRKKEVIDLCLETFVRRGLSETSVRDLSGALHLHSGGIYTYFANKDEAVVACAEEAALRIEASLIDKALDDMENPSKMIENLFKRSHDMRKLMKFFVSVCALEKYEKEMHPVLSRVSERYKTYTVTISEKLNCTPEDIAPYVYMTINTMSSYMLFGQDGFTAPQMELAQKILLAFLEKRNFQNT